VDEVFGDNKQLLHLIRQPYGCHLPL
jgi:hypothetical protein